MKQRHWVAVMQAAMDYEEAWNIYANPFTNLAAQGKTNEELVLQKAKAHQALLEAIRYAKERR